jgi:ABC-type uncharacterized transport system ATPase subunit
MRGISKVRAGQACAAVDSTLFRRHPRAPGENGAGKTSLMNVLFGTYAPMRHDRGRGTRGAVRNSPMR